MSTKTTIMVCMKCDGKGYHHYDELTDYHKREYTDYYEKCDFCKSTGLISKTVTETITYEAHLPGIPDRLKPYERVKKIA